MTQRNINMEINQVMYNILYTSIQRSTHPSIHRAYVYVYKCSALYGLFWVQVNCDDLKWWYLCVSTFFALVTFFVVVVIVPALWLWLWLLLFILFPLTFWIDSKCVCELCCVHEELNKRKFHANWMWEMFTGHSHSHLSWIVLVLWPQIPINCLMFQ